MAVSSAGLALAQPGVEVDAGVGEVVAPEPVETQAAETQAAETAETQAAETQAAETGIVAGADSEAEGNQELQRPQTGPQARPPTLRRRSRRVPIRTDGFRIYRAADDKPELQKDNSGLNQGGPDRCGSWNGLKRQVASLPKRAWLQPW